jgi:hypothetical protein
MEAKIIEEILTNKSARSKETLTQVVLETPAETLAWS